MSKRTFKNTYIVLFGAFDSDKFVRFSKFETVEDFKKYLDKKCLSYDDGDGIFIHEDDEDKNSCFYICEKKYYEDTGYVADWYHVEFEDFLNNRGSKVTYGEDGESVWYAVGRYDMTEDENLEAIFNDLKAIDGIEIEIDAHFISDYDFVEAVINSKHFGTYAYGEVFNDWVKECNNNSSLKTEQEQKPFMDFDAIDTYLDTLRNRF